MPRVFCWACGLPPPQPARATVQNVSCTGSANRMAERSRLTDLFWPCFIALSIINVIKWRVVSLGCACLKRGGGRGLVEAAKVQST